MKLKEISMAIKDNLERLHDILATVDFRQDVLQTPIGEIVGDDPYLVVERSEDGKTLYQKFVIQVEDGAILSQINDSLVDDYINHVVSEAVEKHLQGIHPNRLTCLTRYDFSVPLARNGYKLIDWSTNEGYGYELIDWAKTNGLGYCLEVGLLATSVASGKQHDVTMQLSGKAITIKGDGLVDNKEQIAIANAIAEYRSTPLVLV